MTAEQIKKSQWLGRLYFIKLRTQSLFSLKETDKKLSDAVKEVPKQCCEILEALAEKSEQKYIEMFQLYSDLRKEIEAAIDSVENFEYQSILSAHYLEGKTWEKISEEMFYSIRSLKYKHLKALDLIEINENPDYM